ncbi:MAG TPA: BadF/BadG/BcrA/BcrD ATPase family protein, partial [Terriglobia bacterium]|nr:BadF/BadG/BcrA/BcrD ATPase family protein [Terriglobia bacterium]
RTTGMSIFIGIDGGGSKTACLVGDERSLLGSGVAGPSNVVRVGEGRAREAMHTAIRQACAQAGVDASKISRTCVGIAGGARSETAGPVLRILSEIISGDIEIVGDMVIAMEAAAGSGPGVVVIAGTGSIAYGRNEAGRTARAGGWGFAISDEGSAHWIGRAVVAAVMRAFDEDQRAALLEALMKVWQVKTREQMIMSANASPPPDFAGLLPTVISAADAKDPIAQDVLAQAGAELAILAKIVIARLFKREQGVAVATSGGVFRNAALVRQIFYNHLRLKYPKIIVSENVVDPVKGALALARRGMQAAASG